MHALLPRKVLAAKRHQRRTRPADRFERTRRTARSCRNDPRCRVRIFEPCRHRRWRPSRSSWGSASEMVATFDDGTVRRYAPCSADHSDKIWQCAESVQTGRPVACGVDGALPLTLCVAAAHASPAPIASFPHACRRSFRKDGDTFIFIDGLAEVLQDCFKRWRLPAEAGNISWAKPAGVVDASVPSLLSHADGRATVEVSVT